MLVHHLGMSYFVLDNFDWVVLLLEASMVVEGSCTYYSFRLQTDSGAAPLVAMPVLDFAEWTTTTIEWLSPMAQHLLCNTSKLGWSRRLARAVSAAQLVLKFSAAHACFDIKGQKLDTLARIEYKTKLPNSCPEKVFNLIRLVLGCDERTACSYMDNRLVFDKETVLSD